MSEELERMDDIARQEALSLQNEAITADPDTLRLMFLEARTHYGWQDKPVALSTLHRLYDIAKMGPTSMNQQPMRVVFVQSQEAKERLKPCLFEGNIPKMMSAPVTAIIAYDVNFFEELPRLFPPNPNAEDIFKNNATAAQVNAFRNGTLQGAYFMLAARAVGLDIGGMSGFDNGKVDEEFFHGTSLRSNFLCNIGYADTAKIFRRLPRLAFDEACEVLGELPHDEVATAQAGPHITKHDVLKASEGMLQKQLYAVFTRPTNGMGPVMEVIEKHLEFQVELESKGIMFGAGPFWADNEVDWHGEGMVLIRADSLQHAKEIAAADPMHSSGARAFEVRPWLLNEGTLTVRIDYSTGKREIT